MPAADAADAYPMRAVEFIVPWGPGGGSDQTARELSKLLQARLKTPFPVVNVPGGTGSAGMAKMLSSPADGYSISLLAWDTFALLAGNQPPNWTMSDFVTIAIVIQLPSGLYVSEDSPFKTWADVEKAAKANPDSLRVAISGFGSPDDLSVHALAKAGLTLKAVPFAQPGERYSALLGNHVELLYSPIGNIGSFVAGNQMRPILFFNDERIKEYPDIPTAKEVGYPISLPQRRAVIVKAGTPSDVVTTLSTAVAEIVKEPEYVDFLKQELASPSSYVATDAANSLMEKDLAAMRKMAAKE
jgi:tripartite-type tricarboxylate transporter receptor subunit TctC